MQPSRPRGEDVESSNEQLEPSVYTSKNGQIDVVRSLLDCGVGQWGTRGGRIVDWAWCGCEFPMHGWPYPTAGSGHLDVVRLLLDHNADFNACQRNQRTALDLASANGYLDIVRLLLQRGANANVWNSYGRTPRQEALAYGHGRIAESLLKYSAFDT